MTEPVKPSTALRRVHVDFHTPDFIRNVGEKFDAKRYAEALARGEVQQAAFFAKCHYGNAYYPTKVGRPHPGLSRDMLGEFVAAAGKKGIRTFAYYSLQFDRWYGKQHPNCIQHPQPFFEPRTGPWTALCINGPYGEYAREQMAEVVRAYDVAGIWLDIVGYYPVCVCARCRGAYQQSTEKALPFDDSRPQAGIRAEYYEWQRRMLDQYTASVAKMIWQLRKGCELLCNTATGIREKSAGIANQADCQWCEEAVGHSPVELTTVSIYTSLFDNAEHRRTFEIITQRFHMGWGDWTVRPVEALKYDVATIVAHGGVPSIGDQLYGDGRFEPLAYERIGETYRWLKVRQDFCGATVPAAEIGVYAWAGGHATDPGGINYNPAACRFGEGLFKALLDARCPVAALSDVRALQTGRYILLLTDENLPDTEDAVEAVKAFVASGGRWLSVGVPPQRYWPMLGIAEAQSLPGSVCYIQMKERSSGDLSMPVLSRVRGQRVTLKKGAEALGYWTHPLCERDGESFYSHQHAPPGPVTKEPAVWEAKHGAGRVIAIAAPIATDYWHACYSPLREIIMACVEKLLAGRRQVYVEGLPPSAEVTLRRNEDAIFVHVVSVSISRPGTGIWEGRSTFYLDEPATLRDVTAALQVPEGHTCRNASQLRKTLKVAPDKRRGYVRVRLAPFQTHTVVRFALKRKAR